MYNEDRQGYLVKNPSLEMNDPPKHCNVHIFLGHRSVYIQHQYRMYTRRWMAKELSIASCQKKGGSHITEAVWRWDMITSASLVVYNVSPLSTQCHILMTTHSFWIVVAHIYWDWLRLVVRVVEIGPKTGCMLRNCDSCVSHAIAITRAIPVLIHKVIRVIQVLPSLPRLMGAAWIVW